MKTPELNKIAENQEVSQKIGEFIDWLQSESGYSIGKGVEEECECCGETIYSFIPISKSIKQLLAEYFEIDLAKAEKEKRALLDEIRKAKT